MNPFRFILAIVALLASAATAAPIVVALDQPVTRGIATYSAVQVREVAPDSRYLDVRTTLGTMRLCYPGAETDNLRCAVVLTQAQMAQATAAFIQTTIPMLVKTWAAEQ